MSHISEPTTVYCGVNQAAQHFTRYFAARANSDGDIARVHLRAEVPATLVPSQTRGARLGDFYEIESVKAANREQRQRAAPQT